MTTYHRARPIAEASAEGPPWTVYVAPLPDGPPLVLGESAALIWECLPTEPITATEIAEEVASLTGADPQGIIRDVVEFLDSLVVFGVAVRSG